MAKHWPPRPDNDFRITSFEWQLDIEAQHHQAGFPAVESTVIRRRYWQFVDFLQRNGLAAHTIAASVDEIALGAELRNFDLTPTGYAFAQRYADRWLERMYKDGGAEKEERILEKWHLQFVSDQTGT